MLWFLSAFLALAIAVSPAAATHFTVEVGANATLTFNPKTLIAQSGDVVTYNFHPKNHSVTQSSFADPCHPLDGGFFSGFVPTQDLTAASPTTWTITVNDTKPIWMYCGQTTGNHCQSGMVHAINAPTTGNTIEVFEAKAKTASPSTSPPNGLPIGGLRKTSVLVGISGASPLMYKPNNISALVGEVIEFSFSPANHSVVQSSFADPCHPLAAGGFSSGFVPTNFTPSGVTFQIVVNDTKPVWFYCAQTKKTHCQAGMVGSINAPTSGNTLEAFTALAAKASDSTIPPNAPLGGILAVNGIKITAIGGDVLDTSPPISNVPPPGTSIPPNVAGMAGGYQPSSYGWANTISDNATSLLQLINFLDNALLEALVNGHNNLTTGGWSNLYPESITGTIGSMTAQAMIHRSTSTDSLQHYSKKMIGLCQYNFPISNVDDFVHVALALLLLEIGLLLDVLGIIILSDTWLLGPLASTLGSKARMAGMVNMIQNHIPAAAPREVMMPADLVYSYVMNHYVVPNSCPDSIPFTSIPPLKITSMPVSGADRLSSVDVSYDPANKGTLSIAWLGPWGGVEYTPVVASNTAGQGTASVPVDLSGHVFGVLTNATGYSAANLAIIAVAGPEMIWVTQPS